MTDEASEIFEIIEWAIFTPLYEAIGLPPKEIAENSRERNSYIKKLIKEGELTYTDGVWKGSANAKLSKALLDIGVVYSGALRAFTGIAPKDIAAIAAKANEGRQEIYSRLLKATQEIPDRIKEAAENMSLEIPQVKPRTETERIGISKISKSQIQEFKNGYNDGVKRAFENFGEKETDRLRSMAQTMMMDGASVREIAKAFSERYSVGKERAKFWARQESHLLAAGIQNKAMAEMGVRWYIWRTVGDNRTRHDHKELNGKLFNADDPPIMNISEAMAGSPQRRGNPSTDYNCRCHAVWLGDREAEKHMKKHGTG